MKKLLKGTIVLLALLLCVSANAMIATAQVSDDPMVTLVLSLRDQGNDTIYSVASANDVYSLTGDVKYTLLTLSPYGYVVILNEGGVPLEYSLAQPTGGNGPVNPTDSQMYYAGPGNYYIRDANNNILSNIGVVENEQIESAIEWENNVIESLQLGEYYIDGCAPVNHGTAYETYIFNPDYYKTLSEIPDNDNGSCGPIAVCMLLGYYRYQYGIEQFVAPEHRNGKGTNNNFRDSMIDWMKCELFGSYQTYPKQQFYGLERYLKEAFLSVCDKGKAYYYGQTVADGGKYKFALEEDIKDRSYILSSLQSKIMYGYPIVLGTPSHAQIAYGFKEYSLSGKIELLTHNGYKDNFGNLWGFLGSNYAVWVNSNLVMSAFSVNFETEHTLDSNAHNCAHCSIFIDHVWSSANNHKCTICNYIESHSYTFFNHSGHIVSCFKCGYGSGTLEGHNYEVYLDGGFIWKKCINCYYRYNTGNSINSPNITVSW